MLPELASHGTMIIERKYNIFSQTADHCASLFDIPTEFLHELASWFNLLSKKYNTVLPLDGMSM